MKTPTTPPGPRFEKVASRWHTLPAKGLQRVTTPSTSHRLEIPYTNVPADRLPSGLPRPDRIKIESAFIVGAEFHFLGRVVRDERSGTLLQVETSAYDLRRNCRVPLSLSVELLARVYCEMARRYLAAQGRAYCNRGGAGRN